ncbi:DUF5694 domain-containing protein, partial [Dokdonella sp.]|uniref:DUF5694 domain-containing protein n=1 Tax=Dokdonella sp. TaxID=2291710 RepID=UPI003C56D867
MHLCVTLSMGLVLAASVRAEAPVEIMILGTYHMANPGKDIHNMEADDVLAPHRQEQLQEVVDSLARFKPTRVAVEWEADEKPARALPAYRDYLDGKRETSRNEIDQVAFRLAKKMNLANVQGIDADGNFPYETVQAYASKTGRSAELQQAHDDTARKIKAFSASQRTSSIGELLISLNSPQSIRDDSSFYMKLLPMGSGTDQPGAELVGQWTMRNIQICARLAQIVEPGDRVVVVYGAGHNTLLRQCVVDMPNWTLVEANTYLP